MKETWFYCISTCFSIKIGDFGLCRNSDGHSYYGHRNRLPWKWMAPESLEAVKFSEKSDVYVSADR